MRAKANSCAVDNKKQNGDYAKYYFNLYSSVHLKPQ